MALKALKSESFEAIVAKINEEESKGGTLVGEIRHYVIENKFQYTSETRGPKHSFPTVEFYATVREAESK